MVKEKQFFESIRTKLCAVHRDVTEGKMMSSPAIHYQGKVFAFFSRKDKMVFKLEKNLDKENFEVPLIEFSPFKTKKPLAGWYEVGYEYCHEWENLTSKALELIKTKK